MSESTNSKMERINRSIKGAASYIYIILILFVIFPFDLVGMKNFITAPVALFLGLFFAMCFDCPFPKFNKKTSKYLLQISVVLYGFGMNLQESLKSGAEGMAFTVASVVGVMVFGVLIGRWLYIDSKTSYLISSGTAICGGSAIAAVGPVLKANSEQMAVSLGVVFILNAIALFIFPPIGRWFEMSQQQFGTWAAIAIHDTSSVVGAGTAYGQVALNTAMLIKLTRALWIIPLAFVTMAIFRNKGQNSGEKTKVSIPWFIFLFVLAMVINTYCGLPTALTSGLKELSVRGMILTLFLIGASLTLKTIKSVGHKPLLLAIFLWIIIGVSSFVVVELTIP